MPNSQHRVHSQNRVRFLGGLSRSALGLVVASLLIGCGGSGDETSEAATSATLDLGNKKPPIILLSIDTLRADRLPAYGYDGVETPHIDALRKDSILYQHAYSHIPLTLPSHASLFTGALPPEHGIRDNIGYVLDETRLESGDLAYLPSLLKDAGYATGAAVSTYVLRSKMGLNVDFDFYEDSIEFRPGVGLGGMQRSGAETFELSKSWLQEAAGGPFLYFFHIYEPHSPYKPPSPFAEQYDDPYDGEVAYSDQIIGSVLDELKRLGVYDDAVILLFSDHGEGLGDHGEEEHGVLLYETTLHIPLMLKLPQSQFAGETVLPAAQLVDVLPTVAQLLGFELTQQVPGTSLLNLLGDNAPKRRIYSETFYPRLHFGWSDLASLIDGEHHYIEGPDPELYDLQQDPDELNNVLRDLRRLYQELRDELATIDRTLQAPGEVDEESRQALAALGYMGSSSGALEGPLPDPKTKMDSLLDLKKAFQFHGQKKDAEAVVAFDRVLADNPNMLDAWEFKARSLERLGRRQESLDAYQRAIEISGGGNHVLTLSAASLLFDLGRYEDAKAHAKLALDSHDSFAHGLLARIALEQEDLDEAERRAKLALDDEKPRLGPQITLAAVLHGKGQLEEALKMSQDVLTDFAARQSEDTELIQGLHLLRGKVLADLGQVQAAETAFGQEIQWFPENHQAYANLALLYGLTGRAQQVTPTLRQMVEAANTDRAYVEAVKTLRVLGYDPGAEALLRHARSLFPGSEALAAL